MPVTNIQAHKDQALMLNEIKKVRDCIKGAPFVKFEGQKYLSHPSDNDKETDTAKARYKTYIDGAEFDEVPGQTSRALVGKLDPDSMQVEVPERISYLINDFDGDGLSIHSATAQICSNVLAVKWHVLVTDYQGLTGVDTTQLSKADISLLNPRAVIKQYTRENVVNWDFRRINGKLQLSYIALRELTTELNQDTMEATDVESYLILALDGNGSYYQKKIVKTSNSGLVEGVPIPMFVNKNQPLKWLPVQIVADEPIPAGMMPQELGYLAPICDKALAAYRVSADYKEAMRLLPPTTNVYGMTTQSWEEFEVINERKYVATGAGAVNVFGENVRTEIQTANTELEGYERYFDKNEDKARSLGAAYPNNAQSQRTAAEANIDSAEQTSRLVTISTCVEDALTRSILYAGMFEGLWGQDAIEQNDQVKVEMKRDFTNTKISAQEVQQILAAYMAGIYDREEVLNLLEQGGWTVSTADELLSRVDAGGGVSLTGNA